MLKYTLLFFSFLLSTALHSQIQIAPPIDLFEPVGDIVYNIALDVDGDDDLEVIVATSSRLFWVELLEDGSFSRQNIISPVGLTYRSLAAADIDEDGDDDLIFASQDAGLGAHFNLGNGEWGPAVELYYPGVIIDCFVADLNGDDHLDIITSSSSEVRWLAGFGNGNFGSAQLISDEHVTTTSIHAEDLDNDGDMDVLVAALASDRLSWHENLGGGNFSDFQVINDSHNGPKVVTTADFDGDELPDVVVVNRQEEDDIGAGLVWYRNLGGGSFELGDTLMARGWHEYVHVEDMDDDGDMDIISCHGLDEMDWLANDGSGNFSAPIELERYAAYLRFVETPDLNNDGLPDVLYGINDNAPQKQTVLWRESISQGEWEPPALVVIGGYNLSKPEVADIDQDGLLDVVVGSDGTDALLWMKNLGLDFSTPKLIARKHNYRPNSVGIMDFNNDGFPDILASSIHEDAITSSDFSVYSNNGDGSFTMSPPFTTYYYPQRDLQMVDMDSDGDLDMLWVNPGYNSLEVASLGWVPNEGDSWGDPILLLSEVVNLYDVLATDFDEDGNVDLVICKQDSPQLSIMEHTGNGNFSAPQEIFNNFTAGLYAQAADVNGDGLIDLIASEDNTSNSEDKIAWWENLGNGELGFQQTIYAGNPPIEKFVYEDFNLDGRKDIIGSTYFDHPMFWLERRPDGTFADPSIIEGTPNRVRGFEFVDMDDDGDWDIVGNGHNPDFGSTDRLFVALNLANDEGISGRIFNDLNTNGEQDINELGVPRVSIDVEPDALAIFADDDGKFTIYGASGTYTLSPQLDDCWDLTTSPASYEVTFDGTATIDSLRFGIASNTETPEAEVTLASAATRCGFTVPFWLNYRNDGCWSFNGEVYLVQSDLASVISTVPDPSYTSGDTLFWTFNELSPGSSRSIKLMKTIAGVDFLGSAIEINCGIIPQNAMGTALSPETFDFLSFINCAYDPNDKQVHPTRSEQPPFMDNYTLFDEKLLYTLRFQNTGTDTAFNIVLRDQLSPDLNWSTFQPGSSSHPYEASLHEDGLLEFHFRDILLPDSTTNEPESHGFVQFEIESLADLEDGVTVENTAGIYFDFNPPIITNTVNSIFVETLPNFTPEASFNYTTTLLEANFTDISTNDPDTWLWEFGDGNSSSEQNPVHNYEEAGTYTVCLTASNDWGSTQYCEEISISLTSTSNKLLNSGIQLFPNPTKNAVWVNCKNLPLPQKLVLYNSVGKSLKSVVIQEKSYLWNLENVTAGTYFIRTENGDILPLIIGK